MESPLQTYGDSEQGVVDFAIGAELIPRLHDSAFFAHCKTHLCVQCTKNTGTVEPRD